MTTYHIYSCYSELPDSWDSFVIHDIFLQRNYLQALEEGAPNNITLFYIAIFTNERLVGIAMTQRVKLYLNDMFRKTEVSCIREAFQRVISKVLKGNILVAGNLSHTGQHGFFFDDSLISKELYFGTLFKALEGLKQKIRKEHGKKIRLIMLKDFFLGERKYNNAALFIAENLHQVSVQPNMIMKIRPEWESFEDYFQCLTKKYRDRYKRARKKLAHVTRKEFDLNTIETNSDKLHELYLNVSSNAKFNTFILPQNHFYVMKRRMKEDFRVFGYYSDNDLIGFSTIILNKTKLETYFLGYNSDYQIKHQLYLNMLYDMAKVGIESKCSEIVYARTAMAIKSSIGAEPNAMEIYMRHTNGILNKIFSPVFQLMNPIEEWEERHPFKE